MKKILLYIVSTLFLCASCSSPPAEVERDPKIPEGYTREPVNAKHVGMYVGNEARQICEEVGKEASRYTNVSNKYTFRVTNGQNSVKAELICTHQYATQVFIHVKNVGTVETRPVIWTLSKKYNEQNHVQSLQVIEKRTLMPD